MDAVLCLVLRAGRLLLLRRSPTAPALPSTWAVPGGMVDEEEEPFEAAIRELREETGMELREPPEFLCTSRTAGGRPAHLFKMNVHPDQDVVLSDEHDDYGWFTVRDCPSPVGPLSERMLTAYTV